MKITWKTCAPHAFPLTRSKWEICVEFSCFCSQNFIWKVLRFSWKAPLFERPLARKCNPMFVRLDYISYRTLILRNKKQTNKSMVTKRDVMLCATFYLWKKCTHGSKESLFHNLSLKLTLNSCFILPIGTIPMLNQKYGPRFFFSRSPHFEIYYIYIFFTIFIKTIPIDMYGNKYRIPPNCSTTSNCSTPPLEPWNMLCHKLVFIFSV